MDEANRKRSEAMMGNQNAVGHGGKGRRTDRHYLAPHTVRAGKDMEKWMRRLKDFRLATP